MYERVNPVFSRAPSFTPKSSIENPHEYVTQLSHIYERGHEHSKIRYAHKHGSYMYNNLVCS